MFIIFLYCTEKLYNNTYLYRIIQAIFSFIIKKEIETINSCTTLS